MAALDSGRPRRVGGGRDRRRRFAFYVEGPSDREMLRIWARRLSPHLARALEPCAVILGGRQPARAVAHFQDLRARDAGVRGVCILDRDDQGDDTPPCAGGAEGLEFYTWPRRHIESYLLVPSAIGRCAGRTPDDPRVLRTLREHLPDSDDEQALALLDAKRLLSPKSSMSRALGIPLSAGRVARALREEELHGDVLALFDRLGSGVGWRSEGSPTPSAAPG